MPRKRVLVVDDNDGVRAVVKASLEGIGGWQVVEASRGRAGFDLAKADPPDAIILDVDMPDWDGPTTLERLHHDEVTAAIPVIFLTARGHTQELISLRSKGLVAILTKPFDATSFVKRVALALQWPIAAS